LKVAGKVLERISELKALYIDPTKNTSDQANYDAEFSTLKSQLTDLASEKFNGVSMFGTAASLTVYTTEDGGTSVTISAKDLSDTLTGVGTITAASSLGGPTVAQVTSGLQNVATMRATNGAEQNRMTFAGEVLTTDKAQPGGRHEPDLGRRCGVREHPTRQVEYSRPVGNLDAGAGEPERGKPCSVLLQ
jgi:flagellin